MTEVITGRPGADHRLGANPARSGRFTHPPGDHGEGIGEGLLRDLATPAARSGPLTEEAEPADVAAYRELRRREFVIAQAHFAGSYLDDVDGPRTVVLVARDAQRGVVGGSGRLRRHQTEDIGGWRGSRLVVSAAGRGEGAATRPGSAAAKLGAAPGAGAALIRAACARAEAAGALRFDATVPQRYAELFGRLGWETGRPRPAPRGGRARSRRAPHLGGVRPATPGRPLPLAGEGRGRVVAPPRPAQSLYQGGVTLL